MAINALSYGFSNYRIDIPKVNPQVVVNKDDPAVSVDNQKNAILDGTSSAIVESLSENFDVAETSTGANLLADMRPRFSNLSDISLNFNKNDDYSFLGSEADINSLDMKKAISDMKKDKIFEDYQFFVGTSDNVRQMFNSEDGKIIKKG